MPTPSLIFDNLASPKDQTSQTESHVKKTQQDQLKVQLDFAKISHQSSEHILEHVLFSPMHYEPGYAYPLLIWLHGPGNDERQIMKMMPLISMRNFVGIAPRGISVVQEEKDVLCSTVSSSVSLDHPTNLQSRTMELARTAIPELVLRLDQEKGKRKDKKKKESFDWPQSEEGIALAEQKVFDCIAYAKEKCHIATKRIFLVGFDSGGTMSFRLAMQYPQTFAGVISLGGSFPEGNLPLRQWSSARDLPAMLAIGKESPVFSPEDARSNLKLFHTAGLSVSVRQYTCGQELSPQMLQDVNRWIMERVCGS